jgi:hypothetical protein
MNTSLVVVGRLEHHRLRTGLHQTPCPSVRAKASFMLITVDSKVDSLGRRPEIRPQIKHRTGRPTCHSPGLIFGGSP